MRAALDFSHRVQVLPVLHGSGDFAIAVRERLLREACDCLAVPLPATFQEEVIDAVRQLPTIRAIVQESTSGSATYIPIDPCQPVIAAIRVALAERIPIAFVDWETQTFDAADAILPDPYALKTVDPEKFLAAILPSLESPQPESQRDQRLKRMAFELHRLELQHERILFLPSLLDWPWIRAAYKERLPYPEHERYFAPINTFGVDPRTLAFFLGELPYITGLYERSRRTLDPDENLSVDGVKELVLAARDRWEASRIEEGMGGRNWLTPKTLQLYLQYVRNRTLMQRRLTPDLYTLVDAAKQVGGDRFAISLIDVARQYRVPGSAEVWPNLRMGIGRAELPSVGEVTMVNRLPGLRLSWRSCELKPQPSPRKSGRWKQLWDPYRQCSWPPEDDRIESFHTHVREQAKSMIGADLARSEKFSTSVKDGIDMRETLRNWHTGEIFVKEVPPARGDVSAVVFLFDVPADPKRYVWQTTWHAEHDEESTIGFFATNFMDNIIGPGIGRSEYGGAMFLFPPRYIPDIWSDPRLKFARSLEDRLVAAACMHSPHRHVAFVSPVPIRSSWRLLARRFNRKLIYLPLGRFSGRLVDKLRMVHVLNGKEVRSFAANFIRQGE